LVRRGLCQLSWQVVLKRAHSFGSPLILFSKDPSGTVTDGGDLQMRRGLRHRLYAMAAGSRDGHGLAQRPRLPPFAKRRQPWLVLFFPF